MGTTAGESKVSCLVLPLIALLAASLVCRVAAAQSARPTATPLLSVRVPISATPLPDLIVLEEDLSLDPSEPFEGRTVFVRFSIKNIGEARAEDITFDAYQREEGDPHAIPQSLASPMRPDPIPALAPGQSATATLRWDAFDNAGDHIIEIIADPQNRIQESDETNNSTSISFHVTPNYITLTEEANWHFSRAKERFRKANTQAEDYREWAPGDPRFLEELDHQFLVYTHMMQGETDLAEQKAREALSVFPKNVPLSYMLASFLLLREATPEALDVIDSVSATWASTEDRILMRMLREKDEPALDFPEFRRANGNDRTVLLLQTSVERFPASPYSWFHLGLALVEADRLREACEPFDKAFFLTRGQEYHIANEWLVFSWSRALHAMRRDQEALEILAHGIKRFNRPFILLFQYADVSFESGITSPHVSLHFVDQIAEARESPFWMTRVFYLRGRIMEKLKNPEKAETAYRMSLTLDASFTPSIKAMEVLGATP